MSFYYSLGQVDGEHLDKEARIGKTLGQGAGALIEGLLDYGLVPGAKNLGKGVQFGLKTPGLGGLTLAGLGLGASAANEGLGAAANYTGLPIPHLFGSKEMPLWSPHLTPYLADPKLQGWGAVGHALSRPIQTSRHMLGYGPQQMPQQTLQGFDPWTNELRISPEQLKNFRTDARGNVQFDYSPKRSPAVTMALQNLQQSIGRMRWQGVPLPNQGAGLGDGSSVNNDRLPSVLRSRPLTMADIP